MVISEYNGIIIVVETKLDQTFTTRQFLIEGFSVPYRLDRYGGGIIMYARESTPSKLKFPEGIEILFIGINLRKTKCLLFGSHHSPNQN